MKKDKEKVLDEVWTEERIKSFLDQQPPKGVDADFHALYTAYKSMRVEDFELFLSFFKGAGRNFAAVDNNGQDIVTIAAQHRYGAEYAAAVNRAKA